MRDAPERSARDRLEEAGAAIVAGAAAHLPRYLADTAGRVLDAWGRVDAEHRARVDADLARAADAATARVVAELRELLARDPAEQVATPLEVLRSAVREPTAVLAGAGVGEVVRDEFEERTRPDDRYGLAPRTFAALAPDDEDLGPRFLAWGTAKAAVLRARSGGSP